MCVFCVDFCVLSYQNGGVVPLMHEIDGYKAKCQMEIETENGVGAGQFIFHKAQHGGSPNPLARNEKKAKVSRARTLFIKMLFDLGRSLNSSE